MKHPIWILVIGSTLSGCVIGGGGPASSQAIYVGREIRVVPNQSDTEILRLEPVTEHIHFKGNARLIFEGESMTFIVYPDMVMAISRTTAGFQTGQVRYLKNELLGTRITCATEDTWHVWVGTDGGINAIEKRTDPFIEVKAFSALPGLEDNYIYAISVDNHGDLWAVTRTGLAKMIHDSRSWQTHRFYGQGRLEITDVFFSEEYVWVGTQKGLIRFNKRIAGLTVYTASDGLPSNHILRFEKSNEILWVVTSKGPARWRPEQLSWEKYEISENSGIRRFQR